MFENKNVLRTLASKGAEVTGGFPTYYYVNEIQGNDIGSTYYMEEMRKP
jgi:hypothetical protein